jgi:hypothetical protein
VKRAPKRNLANLVKMCLEVINICIYVQMWPNGSKMSKNGIRMGWERVYDFS